MITNVHHLLSSTDCILHEVVKMIEISPLEHFPFLQSLRRRIEQCIFEVAESPVLCVHPEDRQLAVLEEGRFVGADDDEVKEGEPVERVVFLLPVPADEVHDDIRVVPQTVGQQKHLPARTAVPSEHIDYPRFRLDVDAGILRDLVLDDAVAMAEVHAPANIFVDLLVSLGLDARELLAIVVDEGDELGVHERVRKREERVDVGEVFRIRKILLTLTPIHRQPLLLLHRAHPVEGDLDVVVPVHLDDVPSLLVDDQTSLEHVRVVLGEAENLLGVSHVLHQLL
mmetsp:Transcript_704/g.1501  ORF Transcript_704/g.1501 Transcript_704/m.1501 type:complete len:283 (-) Transcript_704:489-1337(-)